MTFSVNRAHREKGIKLFTFAVIADTHINQGEVECNSPFDVNRLANMRMRYVVHKIRENREVEFIVHLGDLIHPVPEVENLYMQAAEKFQSQIANLSAPIHLTPGNHDVGDKPVDWSPAKKINDKYIALWQKTFGQHFYSFDNNGCHFCILNAQLMNSGLSSENEQRHWFEEDLRQNHSKRCFLFLHYPPFLCHLDESESYDNIGEPARSWLLGLLAKYKVEALFAGHVHNFWYNRYQDTRLYLLPSTSFVRQDYSEMFKLAPVSAFEFGRNDAPKLGFFLVHVYPDRHIFQFVRSDGQTLGEGEKKQEGPTICSNPFNYASCLPVGFDLRDSWADRIGIPPSGGLDEFDRKEVHNDYPLLALWEMGVRRLRIPLQDLRNPEGGRRISDLAALGFEFSLFSFGMPNQNDLSVIETYKDHLSSWEICVSPSQLDSLSAFLADFSRAGISIFISMLQTAGHKPNDGKPYYHFIRHGFSSVDLSSINAILSKPKLRPCIQGLVFRISADEDVVASIQRISLACREVGLHGSIHIKLSRENPAAPSPDELWTVNRVATAAFSVAGSNNLTVYFDTLVDVDRGYFVRNGVIDRLCNPKMGARVIKNLQSVIGLPGSDVSLKDAGKNSSGEWICLTTAVSDYLLFLPIGDQSYAEIPVPFPHRGSLTLIPLDAGLVMDYGWNQLKKGKILHTYEKGKQQPILLVRSSTLSAQ